MKFWGFFLFASLLYSQTDLHKPELRKIFADHLFCTGDYLRAAEEYTAYLNYFPDDTAEFKIALSLGHIAKTEESLNKLKNLRNNSVFREYYLSEMMRLLIKNRQYEDVRREFNFSPSHNHNDHKLKNFSFLYTRIDSLPSPPYMFLPYNEDEKRKISSFYEQKLSLPRKDPLLAGFLSFLVPGLGKIYTEEYGDAAFAAIMTGVFGYLAYTNFEAGHNFRGWIFSGVTAWFYTGSIYGSAVSAEIFNAKINFSFSEILDSYLELKNYFLPDYGFCR